MSFRPNILKLATKISLESLTYTGITFKDPEYRILDPIVDDDMCEVMMHLRLNTDRPAQEIADRAGKDLAYTQEQLDKLCKAGIVRTRDVNGEVCYYYPVWVPGIMEGIHSNIEQCETYPDLGACFEEYTRRRLAILVPNAAPGMSFMRIIPVEKAIKNNTKAASYDEISTLLENATAISVGPCSCRRARRLTGEGCGHLEDDMCIYLNDNARCFIKSGAHRPITKEEAYEILKRAEDNGLIHELNQTDGFDETSAICNCCGCSCFALRIASYFNTPDSIRSNYVAKVDKDNCVACGQCVENCQVNALKLGKKLCSVTPDAAPAPDPKPTDKFWSIKDYNVDYRTNRTDVATDGTAPCKAVCPLHIPAQAYIKMAAEGRYAEALELIKQYTPFPAVCGRICDKQCEKACTRNRIDGAVAIDDIKRFIADQELKAENRYIPPMINTRGIPYTEKVAVIGAGPAGLSCAYYLKLSGYPVTVFEKEKVPGGMMTKYIPDFRLDKKVVAAEIDVLKKLGIEFKTGVEVGKDVTIDALRAQGYKAFFLGVGAGAEEKPGFPGSELPGVVGSLEFLSAVNGKVKPEVGSSLAVIGAGRAAVDAARSAIRLGAKKVTVIGMAISADTAEAKAEGVEFLVPYSVREIVAGKAGKASAVIVQKLKTEETVEIAATTVITAIGQKADLSLFEKGTKMAFNANGTVIADGMTFQTGESDIFAGGDAVTGPRSVVHAIAAGKEAAVSIHRYVHAGQTLNLGRDHHDYKAFDIANTAINVDSFNAPARQQAACTDTAKAKATFKDLRGGLTEEQVKKEASRCLGCGAAVVNENMCIGCGVCTTKCKFDAIHLEKVRDDKGSAYYKTLTRVLGNAGKRYGKIVAKTIAKPLSKTKD